MPPTQRIEITPAQEALAPVEPCTLVIFGGSGDLARRRLIPALYNLLLDGLLPANFAVLGLGRTTMLSPWVKARSPTVRRGAPALVKRAKSIDWNQLPSAAPGLRPSASNCPAT